MNAITATATTNPLPPDYEAFMKSLTPREVTLMEIAKKSLGSSFFIQWTHAYILWKSKQ
jgi:hypothetical protein